MNWKLAKNFCLFLLIGLNIFLFIMLNASDRKYKLNDEQISAIINLLDKNNIKCENVIKKFTPKRQLKFLDTKIDTEKIEKIFAADKEKILIFSDYGFNLKFLTPSQKYIDENDCKKILKKVKDSATTFKRDYTVKNKIVYRQKFCGFIVFDNFMSFTFENGFLKEISYSFRQPENFFGSAFEIYSPDMILYEFMKNDDALKNDVRYINKFDFVYKFVDLQKNIASPSYSISYNDNYKIFFDAFSGNSFFP